MEKIVILGDTYGDHIPGAPLTYVAYKLDRPQIRRLLALIKEYGKGVQDGLPRSSPGWIVPAADQMDLLPSLIPRRATQRNPYYSVFTMARMESRGRQLLDPALIAHIKPVEYKDPCFRFGQRSIDVSATQLPVARHIHSVPITQDTLYSALTLLTPKHELLDLLREMVREAPQAFLRLISDEAMCWYTPEGKQRFLLPNDLELKLDSATIAALLASNSRSVRQGALTKLARLHGGDQRVDGASQGSPRRRSR